MRHWRGGSAVIAVLAVAAVLAVGCMPAPAPQPPSSPAPVPQPPAVPPPTQPTTTTTTAPPTLPAAPGPATVTSDGYETTFSVTPPADGGSPITGYVFDVTYRGWVLTDSPVARLSGLPDAPARVRVRAVNAVGDGPFGPWVEFQAGFRPPGAPAVVLGARDGGLQVDITPPADAGTSPVTGYLVTVVEYGVDAPVRAVTTATTSLAVTGLTRGVLHQVYVQARNDVGTGAAGMASARTHRSPGAPAFTLSVPAPEAPSVLLVQASVDWGTGVDRRLIGRFTDQLGRTTTVDLDPDEEAQGIEALERGWTYSVVLEAVTEHGAALSSARTLAFLFEPSAVRDLTAVDVGGAVQVTFDPPRDHGGVPLSGYRVRFCLPEGQLLDDDECEEREVTGSPVYFHPPALGNGATVEVWALNTRPSVGPSTTVTVAG